MNPHRLKKQQFNQCLKKPRRETTRESPTMAPETGKENPAPASITGAGAGAISLSWAETAAAAANVTITSMSTKALEMLN